MDLPNDKMTSIMNSLGMTDDAPIEHNIVKSDRERPTTCGGSALRQRKNMLEYDDVMNQQRKSIYALRRTILGADEAGLREQ